MRPDAAYLFYFPGLSWVVRCGVAGCAHRTWRRGGSDSFADAGVPCGYAVRDWGVTDLSDRHFVRLRRRICSRGLFECPHRDVPGGCDDLWRSEEHTSELQ